MAKKMSKSGKQLLSVLFHLAVLIGMVMLYDSVKPLIDKLNLGALISSGEKKKEADDTTSTAKEEITVESVKPDKVVEETKSSGATTMADLMAQKQRQKEKKAEQEKKDN